jgi:hypothetical protein
VPSQPLAVRHNRVAVESHCAPRNVDSDIETETDTDIETETETDIDIDIETRLRRTAWGVVDCVNYPRLSGYV